MGQHTKCRYFSHQRAANAQTIPWADPERGTGDPEKSQKYRAFLAIQVQSSRACLFGSQTMREFSEPVSRNRLGQGHR